MRIFSTLLPLMIGLVISTQVMATSMLPASLQHLSKAAELIFHGKAINNEVKIDDMSGRVATYTTFEVIQLIKGSANQNHTIKQLGGLLPGSDRIRKIHGAPQFKPGEEYVVFLPQVSSLGFSSPLGLSQGSFMVRDLNGVAAVSNGRNIEGLLSGQTSSRSVESVNLRAVSDHPSSAPLVEFLRTVRELAED